MLTKSVEELLAATQVEDVKIMHYPSCSHQQEQDEPFSPRVSSS